MGVGHGVDVAGEAQRILRERDALGKTAACRGTLGSHGGTAGRLAYGCGNLLTASGESLHETDGGGGLAFTEGSRGDGRHVDVFAVGTAGQTGENGLIVHLAHDVAVGKQFPVFKAQFSADLVNVLHAGFRVLSDFPVRVLLGIQSHISVLLGLGFRLLLYGVVRFISSAFSRCRGAAGRSMLPASEAWRITMAC